MSVARRNLFDFNDVDRFAREHGDGLPLRNILFSLHRSHGLLRVKKYVTRSNREVNSEHQALGLPSPAKTIRLAIFKLERKRRPKNRYRYTESRYLGYIMLRPEVDGVGAHRVADVVIHPPLEFRDPTRGTSYLTCSARLPGTEGGRPARRTTTIHSYPFIQKRDDRFACAHAALRNFARWAVHTTNPLVAGFAARFDGRAPTMPDIEKMLLDKHGKVQGISPEDFEWVLRQWGLRPLRYVYNDPNPKGGPLLPPEQIVFPFIESGIPVFLIFKPEPDNPADKGALHVVTIVGHTFDRSAWWPQAELGYYPKTLGKSYQRSIAWIDFVIHDDNFGPFRTLPKRFIEIEMNLYKSLSDEVLKREGFDQEGRKKFREADTKLRAASLANYPLCEIVIPFRDDFLLASQVEVPSMKILEDITASNTYRDIENIVRLSRHPHEADMVARWAQHLANAVQCGHIVLRTFLINQSALPDPLNRAMDDIQARNPNFPDLPEDMWICEISTLELLPTGQRLGFLLWDAMMPKNPNDVLRNLRAIVLPAYCTVFSGDQLDAEARLYPTFSPEPHVIHHLRDYGTRRRRRRNRRSSRATTSISPIPLVNRSAASSVVSPGPASAPTSTGE